MKMKVRYEMRQDVEQELDIQSLLRELANYKVLLPETYRNETYTGPLHGYYMEETKTFNVIPENLANVLSDCSEIGCARTHSFSPVVVPMDEPFLIMTYNGDGQPMVTKIGEGEHVDVDIEYYSLYKDVYARNQGILEPTLMSRKQAILVGVGSGGSVILDVLARSGIGSVICADTDVLNYGNVCRHTCGIRDVGKYKVDYAREHVMGINPDCKVYTFRNTIQDVDPAELEQIVWKESIIICGADNRHAAYFCNELADQYHIPMIAAGCGARASTGEAFYYKPDEEMPCYACCFGEDRGLDYSNAPVRREFYVDEAALAKMDFQPGLSLDIEQTALFAARLAIDLLMEHEKGYQPRLLPWAGQMNIMLNYAIDEEINPYMKAFGSDARPLSWKACSVEKNPECGYCSAKGEEKK